MPVIRHKLDANDLSKHHSRESNEEAQNTQLLPTSEIKGHQAFTAFINMCSHLFLEIL